jgi:hypothetical protein
MLQADSLVQLSGLEWSEVKWSEVKWSEVKWSEVKSSVVVRQSPASKDVNTEAEEAYDVGCRYQATTGEDTTDWEVSVRAVVNCRACELAIAL